METKILDIDPVAIENKLLSLNTKKVFDAERIITYFKNEKDSAVPFLKLTEEGEKLKLSSQNHQTHNEIKLFVSRKKECLELLATLGYFPISKAKARRISYELGSIDIDIDEFPGIPDFMEVDMGEKPGMTFENLISTLGLDHNKRGQYSTPQIVEMYGKDYFKIYKIS